MNSARSLSRYHAIKLVGEKTSTLSMARGRLVVIKGFFMFAFFLVAIRASDLAVLQDGSLPQTKRVQKETLQVARGNILDRNGLMVAATLKTASLYADSYLISDPENAAQGLIKIFPTLSYGNLLKDLQSKKRFVWIRRGIKPSEQASVMKIGEPGLDFKYEYNRFYPQGSLSAHLGGYTSVDNHGIAGLEKSFDGLLSRGKDLTLSIDIRLQHILRREIMAAADEFKAIGGMGVIMDVRNGEILAGVSWPDFHPRDTGKAKPKEQFNRLTLGTYELGSVFKIFSTAAFLENYDVPMSSTFDASEPIKIGRFTINDYHAENRILTIPEVFMHSSNIGSAMMGEAIGGEKLKLFYKDLGLLDRLDLEIPETGKPLTPNPWREVSTLTASYGHGIAVTPMHIATGVSTIVNGGYAVKPTLIIQGKEEVQKRSDISIISPETSRKMRSLMRLVVSSGTGKNADVPGYRVGGKTGTAEKTSAKGYDRKRLISSFVGVFPMDNPRYLVFLAIDEPKGNKKSYGYATAGWVAAPAVSKVISGMVSILGIAPQDIPEEKDMDHNLKEYVTLKNG